MARRPKNPINDISKQVGGWLGGAAKGVQSWSESQARTFTNPYINAAGRAVGKNPNLPTSGVREAVLNTAFAAADIASGPIARSAGKAVSAVGRTVANTGVPARVANKVRGDIIGLHGSPVKGLKEIEPRLSQWSPKGSPPKAFAANPSRRSGPRGAAIPFARETAQDYALGYSASVKPKEPGSIYVVKGKSESGKNPLIISSTKPMKVLAEVEVLDPLSRVKVNQALKRAGVKVPKKK